MEAGNIFGISLFRPSWQSNISTSGEERFKHPLPRENKISQMPYPRDNKDNQIPTPCPAPPRLRLYIDRCITLKLTEEGDHSTRDKFSPYKRGLSVCLSVCLFVCLLSMIFFNWCLNIDKGMTNLIVLLDLAKAFETVSHNILLKKI